MRSVRQADKNDAKGAVARSGAAALAVIGLASGCAGGGFAEVRPAPGRPHAPAAGALDSYATRLRRERAARIAAAKHRGPAEAPPTAPPAPARKPVVTARDGFGAEGRKELDLPPMSRRFLDQVTGDGYAVARLEDHL
ncbi:hypothetical protein [Streptomyces fagopyri]|uniref:hypothetical protein n=1 Tax=Streptomyces fagopyri TaxID=2662397 RepID=UPI00371D7764